jgi:hypothetical protein
MELQEEKKDTVKKVRRGRIKTADFVSQYTIDCVHIKRFDTVKEASEETGISAKDIISNIYGRIKNAGGYRWGYDIDIYDPKKPKNPKKPKELIKNSIDYDELVDVPEYKGLYKITREGRVWNCMKAEWVGSRRRSHLHDYYAKVKGCIGIDKKDFLCVAMLKDKEWRTFDIHRLVAKTFLKNKNNYKYVNHIDFDRTNNKITNLVWSPKVIVKQKKVNNLLAK